MMATIYRKSLTVGILALLFVMNYFWMTANAQQGLPTVDYQGSLAVDKDLDGLTDKGEIDIYKTDPDNPDTDSDGFYDGTEVLNSTDPLDPAVPATLQQIHQPTGDEKNEVHWPWYITRVSGLIGFALLYLSFFAGFAVRIPILRKLFSNVNFANFHCWISVQALIFSIIHAGILLFDTYLKFTLIDILIPFASNFKPALIGSGVIGFYIMIALVVTSYLRKRISYQIWRVIHFFNIVLYIVVFIHALYLGTDLKNPYIRGVFIWATVLLVVLAFWNILVRIQLARGRKSPEPRNVP